MRDRLAIWRYNIRAWFAGLPRLCYRCGGMREDNGWCHVCYRRELSIEDARRRELNRIRYEHNRDLYP